LVRVQRAIHEPSERRQPTGQRPAYLRVLDGDDAGAPHSDLEVLFPTTPASAAKAVENALTAARKLRDSGWRRLAVQAATAPSGIRRRGRKSP
jgi:hypothetical protein